MSEHIETMNLRRNEGVLAWLLGIVSNVLGMTLFFSEIVVFDRTGLGHHTWWLSDSYIPFVVMTVIWSIALCGFFLRLQSKTTGAFGKLIALVGILTGLLWSIHFMLYASALDYGTLALSYIIWCAGTITLGLTILLSGLFYQVHTNGNRYFKTLTTLSFLVSGAFGIIVGYIGGFTLLPQFTVYDIPLVSIVMIVPCVMGLLYHYNLSGEIISRSTSEPSSQEV